MSIKVDVIAGARPNFMKAAVLYLALKDKYEPQIIVTGQHNQTTMGKDILEFFGDIKKGTTIRVAAQPV